MLLLLKFCLSALRQIAFQFKGKCFDKGGLMYHIGSQGRTTDYTNPHKLHESGGAGMVASQSSQLQEKTSRTCSLITAI